MNERTNEPTDRFKAKLEDRRSSKQHGVHFHHLSFGHHTVVIIIEIDHHLAYTHVCNFLNTRLTHIKIFDNIESEFT